MNTLIFLLIVFLIIVVIAVVNLFRFNLNDYFDKLVGITVWLWLPFHALKRLTREFREKYSK